MIPFGLSVLAGIATAVFLVMMSLRWLLQGLERGERDPCCDKSAGKRPRSVSTVKLSDLVNCKVGTDTEGVRLRATVGKLVKLLQEEGREVSSLNDASDTAVPLSQQAAIMQEVFTVENENLVGVSKSNCYSDTFESTCLRGLEVPLYVETADRFVVVYKKPRK